MIAFEYIVKIHNIILTFVCAINIHGTKLQFGYVGKMLSIVL